DVTDIDDPQVAQRVDAEGEVRTGAVVGEVVGGADGLGPEAGAGPVGRAAVEGRADDDDVGRFEGGGVVEGGAGDPEERDVGAVHGGHGPSVPYRPGGRRYGITHR